MKDFDPNKSLIRICINISFLQSNCDQVSAILSNSRKPCKSLKRGISDPLLASYISKGAHITCSRLLFTSQIARNLKFIQKLGMKDPISGTKWLDLIFIESYNSQTCLQVQISRLICPFIRFRVDKCRNGGLWLPFGSKNTKVSIWVDRILTLTHIKTRQVYNGPRVFKFITGVRK